MTNSFINNFTNQFLGDDLKKLQHDIKQLIENFKIKCFNDAKKYIDTYWKETISKKVIDKF